MTAIIGGKSCRSCEFILMLGNNQLFCRRYPPTPFAIPVPGPGGKMALTVNSSYPPVNPAQPCGEYQRSEANAEAELREAASGNGGVKAAP